MGRKGTDVVQSRPITLAGRSTNGRIMTTAELPPKEEKGLSPTAGSPARGPASGGQAPRTFGSEGQQDLL